MTETTPSTAHDAPLTAVDAAAVGREVATDLEHRVVGGDVAAIENRPGMVHNDHTHAHSDTLLPYTMVMGRKLPYPLYTVVFMTLAVLTIVEVGIVEIFPAGWLATLLLIVLSGFKAVLVVAVYMHLREDSRIFAVALALPVLVALIATLFLAMVPPTGY